MRASRSFFLSLLIVIVSAVLAAPARAEDPGAAERVIGEKLQKAQQAHEEKRYGEARKLYDEIIAFAEKADLAEEVKRGILQIAWYNKACALSLEGEKEAALAALEKALEAGFDDYEHMAEDSDLSPIRDLPRYKEIVAKGEERAKAARAEAAKKEAAEVLGQISKEAAFPFDFDLTTVDGKPVKLSDYKGKVLLVDVWGTWCPPCRAEIPHLVALYSALEARGFDIVGLNWERGENGAAEKVKKFMAEQKIPYPCALVDEKLLAAIPDFQGFPTMLLLDRQGRVRLKRVGYTEEEVLKAAIEKLLEEAAPGASGGGQVF